MSNPSQTGSPIPAWVYRYGLLLGIVLTATAFWRSTPLMPGQLSAVHAGFEAECERCHAPAGGRQDPACRKCHADIGTTSRSVIHIGSKENCSVCHPKTRYEAPPKCDGCHDAAMKYQPGQKL